MTTKNGMKSKVLFDGEWVKTSPMVSKRFGAGVVPKCQLCGKASCSVCWYSVKKKVFMCCKCFTPEILK